MTTELKPCPFCVFHDGLVYAHHDDNSDHRGDWCWYVKCNCTAQGPSEKTEEEAIKAWNERAA